MGATTSKWASRPGATAGSSATISRSTSSIAIEERLTSEVDLFNGPVEPTNDVNVRSVYVQDGWKFNSRLTLNLGLRLDHYTDGWPEQSMPRTACRQLAGTTDQRIIDFFTPRTIEAKVVSKSTTVGPRAGFAYDLRGDSKSVIKGFYGRFYFNSADIIADNQNPVGFAQLRYQFVPCTATVTTRCDLNGNRLLDSPPGARQLHLDAGRRRLRHGRSEPEATVWRRDFGATSSRSSGKGSLDALVRLQEHPKRVGGGRSRAGRRSDRRR